MEVIAVNVGGMNDRLDDWWRGSQKTGVPLYTDHFARLLIARDDITSSMRSSSLEITVTERIKSSASVLVRRITKFGIWLQESVERGRTAPKRPVNRAAQHQILDEAQSGSVI